MKLPDDWPSWIPPTCAAGHQLVPGQINYSWVPCRCPGAGDGRSGGTGHHVVTCRVLGCRAPALWPPEHT